MEPSKRRPQQRTDIFGPGRRYRSRKRVLSIHALNWTIAHKHQINNPGSIGSNLKPTIGTIKDIKHLQTRPRKGGLFFRTAPS